MILLAGGNTALLEGLAQALANTGHRVVVADSREEAEDAQARLSPILTVAERGLRLGWRSERSLLRGNSRRRWGAGHVQGGRRHIAGFSLHRLPAMSSRPRFAAGKESPGGARRTPGHTGQGCWPDPHRRDPPRFVGVIKKDRLPRSPSPVIPPSVRVGPW
jgi:hypothetical protein